MRALTFELTSEWARQVAVTEDWRTKRLMSLYGEAYGISR
jgi:hypothetical protein